MKSLAARYRPGTAGRLPLPIIRGMATCLCLRTDLRRVSGLQRCAVSWARFCGLTLQLERSRVGITETRDACRNTTLPSSGVLEHHSACRATEPRVG
ncbi:hypothetical protein NDU88_001414 [Pleurodeles waltl]|uniref:Transposase InsH N-terminal domain-containing protein n=1 Tax=Pleurodeles waltl TaxID=8319 RepID=A0AAV7L9H6_PLEWA|nr:hypothetical protein NDU88_001414 [Pleurodeles waltl]